MARSDNIYESSGSQFFRTTTGIQLGQDAVVELRTVMTFSYIPRVNDRDIMHFEIGLRKVGREVNLIFIRFTFF